MGVLLQWGPHAFESGGVSYEDLTHQVKGRWKEHEIIGRRPAGQYLGPDKETLSLKGVTFALDARGARTTIQAMQASARAGETHMLVSGRGEVLGVWRLEQARRDESYPLDNGAPLRIAYQLEFALHEDEGGMIWSLWP